MVDAGSPPSLLPPRHPSLPSLPPALCPASRLQSLRTIWQAREERDAVFQHIEQLLHLQSPLRSPQRAFQEEEETALVARPLSRPMSQAVSALAQEPYALVGKVLSQLDALGLADDTLVVYSSDHGDQLGERGLWWKQTFFDESAKVPLIVAWPGVLPAGERRAQVLNLLDVGPTLLEAAGAPALPGADGNSFLAVARDAAAPWLDVSYSEYCTDGSARWDQGNAVVQRMVRADRWKYI